MADTRVQLEVEDWVRRKWMPDRFGVKFHRERLKLRSGGVFDFDAVGENGEVVACISTSGGHTAGGKLAVGKLLKLRSDMYFLLLTECKRRLIVLTEKDMFRVCQNEVKGGRVPQEIEFFLAEIPADLRRKLEESKKIASREVSPGT